MARVSVEGDSMRPALEPGDRLWVLRFLAPRPGDVVAVADPRQPERTLVKRVDWIDPATGRLRVLGDNPAHSTDSRHLGEIDPAGYRGRAVYRYSPAARAGWLRRATSEPGPAL